MLRYVSCVLFVGLFVSDYAAGLSCYEAILGSCPKTKECVCDINNIPVCHKVRIFIFYVNYFIFTHIFAYIGVRKIQW